MGQGTFSTWKTRGTVPSGATLQKIAEYFGVSVDYLLGKSEQKEKPSEEGENVVIVSRNGERLEHRLNPEQIKLLEDMISSSAAKANNYFSPKNCLYTARSSGDIKKQP